MVYVLRRTFAPSKDLIVFQDNSNIIKMKRITISTLLLVSAYVGVPTLAADTLSVQVYFRQGYSSLDTSYLDNGIIARVYVIKPLSQSNRIDAITECNKISTIVA